MSFTREQVLQALSTVEEPDLKQDLVTLKMIRDIHIDEDSVQFTVMLTTPACPLKEKLRNDCTAAIHEHLSADLEVEIKMDSEVTSIRQEGPILPGVKNIIAVASGKGGVGKSTVASNLALSLSVMGAQVGLLDADISGPSIPTMFGAANEKPGVVKKDDKNVILPVERYGIKLLSIGFLAEESDAVVWRGPMMSSALRQFISDADWGELDYLIVDLPPGTSDIHLTLVQTVPVTGAVVVTTPQKVAMADAIKGVAMFQQQQINVPVLGIIENMAWFTPKELPENKYYIFGEEGGKRLAERFELPLLGQIPLVMGIRESGDAGKPAAVSDDPASEAFRDLGEEVARQVSIRNATMAKTEKVEIKT